MDIDRPFRAEVSEELRSDLKRRLNDEYFPLDWRASCALELGWLVTWISATQIQVLTHNGYVVDFKGTCGIQSKAKKLGFDTPAIKVYS